MLLDLPLLVKKYSLQINGVIHVGGHLGEEAPIYDSLGIKKVIWFEGNPAVMSKLHDAVEPYGHIAYHALVTDKHGEIKIFNITNYDGMSSSILKFGTHAEMYPDVVFEKTAAIATTTLDALSVLLNFDDCNMLVMDVQGAEKLVLLGAEDVLPQFDVVLSEVNNDQVYVDCAQIGELDDILKQYGLHRVETSWVGEQGWGDALYCRPNPGPARPRQLRS